MSTPVVPEFDATDDVASMCAALDEAGCLVVHGMTDEAQREAVKGELAPHMDATHVAPNDDPGDFYPGLTRRIVSIMHRSPTMRELMMHPLTEQLGDHHLGANAKRWVLNVTAGLEIGPGARDQILHREDDLFRYFTVPRPNLILASMWAMSDFTVDNGGTQLVPGSHRWEAGREAEPGEVVRAQMPAGSVLYWAGGTLHGGGANVTADDWRYGVILTYVLDWLRTEENQAVSMPLADALALPDDVKARLGFAMDYGDGGLNFFDPRPALGQG